MTQIETKIESCFFESYNPFKGDDKMVAQKMKILRMEQKLTQYELAVILKISREAYSMYENEKRQPNHETLCMIADYYNVSLDYLFGRTNIRSLPVEMNEKENKLLLEYRALDGRGKENILTMADLEYARMEGERNLSSRQHNIREKDVQISI
jgi:transcriptional regulator with XRE-family HTH domain